MYKSVPSLQKITLLFFLFCFQFGFCQWESMDQKMEAIPTSNEASVKDIAAYITSNFSTDSDKIRAVFYWISTRINYDVENMYHPKPQTSDEKIKQLLTTKKGVCMHYSELFKVLASECGMKAVVIEGYTKEQGVIAPLGHSWNAALVNGTWKLYDVTWGAGYVLNQMFVKKLNNFYFDTPPSEFIKSHIPFDFMWQLLERPITQDDFYTDTFSSDKISSHYEYAKEIDAFEKQNTLDRLQSQIHRLEVGGLKNSFLVDKMNLLKKEMENFKNNSSVPKLMTIVKEFNDANAVFNEFIFYRNKRFIPAVSDEELKMKIQKPIGMLFHCRQSVSEIKDISKENEANFISLKKSIEDAINRFEVQLDFVNEYLTKDAAGREAMFLVKKKITKH